MKKILLISLVVIISISTIGFASNFLFKNKTEAINHFENEEIAKKKYHSVVMLGGIIKADYEGNKDLTIDWGEKSKNDLSEFKLVDNRFEAQHLYMEKGKYNVTINLDGKKVIKEINIKEAPIKFKNDNLRFALFSRLNTTKMRKKGLVMEIEGLIYPSQAKYLEKVSPYTFSKPLDDIDSLQGIEHFTNLKNLNLSHNNIVKLEPLRNLNKLEILKLHYNKIEEVNNLIKLKNIKELDLRKNKIVKVDFSESELNNLKKLYLQDNKIKDIDLGNLNITTLNIANNPIDNLSFLTKLNKLEHLVLKNNDIDSIKVLLKLDNLKSVEIDNIPQLDQYNHDSETYIIKEKLKEKGVKVG